jgi:hypothetical protein
MSTEKKKKVFYNIDSGKEREGERERIYVVNGE